MLFAAFIERVRIWRRERETLTELKRLTERDLFDIGINPVDVSRHSPSGRPRLIWDRR